MAAQTKSHAALIERLQVEAVQSPQAYRFKLALLAILGFGILWSVLALVLGPLLALAIYFQATGQRPGIEAVYLAMPLALGLMLLRALWIRIEAPSGYRLQVGEAPLLEDDVERLRTAIGAPALDGIIIDGDLNAAAASVPRMLGMFGHRHYLVLGLPLMQLLDRDELASVVAHEFGHFSARHGRFSTWIYRVRMSWHRVLKAFSNTGFAATRLLSKFFDWYVPYFNAYSFVLARGNEYEADAAAVRATNPETAASALIRMELASCRLETGFWPSLQARARSQPHPPPQLQVDLARVLRDIGHGGMSRNGIARLLQVTRRETDLADTHPTLPQRLAGMQATPALRVQPQDSAAVQLLGECVPIIERQLDQQWRKDAEADWRERYEAAGADRARLAEIEGRMTITPDEAVQYAQLVDDLRPDFDARPLYAQALQQAPKSAMTHYRCGLLHLRHGEWTTGLSQLRHAMELDAGAIRPALARLQEFELDPAVDAHTASELAALRMQYAPRAQSLDAREIVDTDDALIPHDLDADALRQLTIALAQSGKVGQAWIARKGFDLAEEPPHYAILVTWQGSVASESAGLKRLTDGLSLPGSFTVFTDTDGKQQARRVRQSCPQPVYRKGRA